MAEGKWNWREGMFAMNAHVWRDCDFNLHIAQGGVSPVDDERISASVFLGDEEAEMLLPQILRYTRSHGIDLVSQIPGGRFKTAESPISADDAEFYRRVSDAYHGKMSLIYDVERMGREMILSRHEGDSIVAFPYGQLGQLVNALVFATDIREVPFRRMNAVLGAFLEDPQFGIRTLGG